MLHGFAAAEAIELDSCRISTVVRKRGLGRTTWAELGLVWNGGFLLTILSVPSLRRLVWFALVWWPLLATR
jgi:hypothetical protein